jgi:uncharacterized Zn-binding protein involved in type VI secretion
MKPVQRLSDNSTRNGKIVTSLQALVFEDTKAFSVSGSIVKEPSMITKTGQGSSFVFIEGKSINHTNDIDLSTGIRTGGSGLVFIQ